MSRARTNGMARRRRIAEMGQGPEPAMQVVMLAIVAVELLVLAAMGRPMSSWGALALGLLGVGSLLQVAAAAAGRDRRTVPRARLVSEASAVVNVGAFGVLLGAEPDAASGVMIVLPLTYLGRLRPLRGVILAGVVAVTFYLLPAAALGAGDLTRPTALVVLGLVMSLFIAAASQAWADTRAEGDRQRLVVDTLLQTVDVGLVLTGSEGEYEIINRRHEEFVALAYPQGVDAPGSRDGGQVYAADGTTLLPAADRPSGRAARGEEFAGQVIYAGQPGSVQQRALSASARPVYDEDGARLGAVLAYHDITGTMQALRAKDEFIAMVSHELRTPLASIIGYLEIASDSPGLPTGVRTQLEVAERNALRLQELVADLLTAAADGKLVATSSSPLLLHELVEGVLAELEDYVRGHGVEIECDLDEVPVVVGDRAGLCDVVTNLVSNAVKYSDGAGAVSVEVRCLGGVVRLAVADEGRGMDATELAQAFSPFYRSPSLSDQSIGGVGLGLPISRGIVERHGGRIWLESTSGHGTTAVVELPTLEPVPASRRPTDDA